MFLLLMVQETRLLITRKTKKKPNPLFCYFIYRNHICFSVKAGSIGCLEALVNHDEVDLDIQNRIEGDTPLHLAVQFANMEHDMGFAMVDLLLAGGADPK